MHAQQATSRRLDRERRTIGIMIEMYCGHAHADTGAGLNARDRRSPETGLCPDCAALARYAERRIERCRFGDRKPVCAKCAVHCYKPEMQERIKTVMRYAGPRMLLSHPSLAVRHMIDRARRVPSTP